MVTKTKNKNEGRGKSASGAADATRAANKALDKRKRLLARVAGQVAAAVITDPSPSTSSAEGIAQIAVDIAEAILQKVGI